MKRFTVVQHAPMIEGIDKAVDTNRAERRAALAQLDSEFTSKGLYRSGARIRESAKELGRSYEALARQLLDIASKQADATAAYAHVGDILRTEHDHLRTQLTEIVNGIDGGTAAIDASLEILDEARDRVERDAAQLIDEAEYAASGFPSVLETEDGDVIATGDGEPIGLEGDSRVTEDGDRRITADSSDRVTADSDRRINEALSFGDTVEAEIVPKTIPASGWTGRLSQEERVQVVKSLAPVAKIEIQALIDLVADQRFNDELTQDALEQLRRLHDVLGQLIEAADQGKPLDQLLAAFGQDRDKFFSLLKQGANVVIAAPALTFGMVKLLAALCGAPIDGGLVAGVYAAMLYKLCGKGKG